MKKIAIIPLRSGSKGIPNKNKRKMLGRALYQWTLGEAIFSELDKIYVFTDDEEILNDIEREYKWTEKVEAFERSLESATDTATTEYGMLELIQNIDCDFDIYCLIQATSPLLTRYDINRCIAKVEKEKFDSALSVVESKRFIWSADGKSVNYNYSNRPRRQDFEGVFVENGAVYAITKQAFLENRNRLGGKIGIVIMEEDSLVEIDELSDWHIVESLLKNRLNKKKKFSQIRYLVLDVDGVFTNGTVGVSKDGELFKSFSLRDGMGLELLRLSGIQPIVITSENSMIVKKRMEKLKIKYLHLGVRDKYSRLEQFLIEKSLSKSELAYIGDDINDLSNICAVGLSFSPSDAIDEVKKNVDYVLHSKGGDKVIRESVDIIIKYNQKIK